MTSHTCKLSDLVQIFDQEMELAGQQARVCQMGRAAVMNCDSLLQVHVENFLHYLTKIILLIMHFFICLVHKHGTMTCVL